MDNILYVDSEFRTYSTTAFAVIYWNFDIYFVSKVVFLLDARVLSFHHKDSNMYSVSSLLTGFLAVTPEPFFGTRGTYPPFFDGSGLEIDSSIFTTTQKARKLPGSCFTWGGTHYKSFDGKVYR